MDCTFKKNWWEIFFLVTSSTGDCKCSLFKGNPWNNLRREERGKRRIERDNRKKERRKNEKEKMTKRRKRRAAQNEHER